MKAATTRPFDEVRPQLEEQLKAERADQQLAARATELADRIDAPADLDTVGKETGFPADFAVANRQTGQRTQARKLRRKADHRDLFRQRGLDEKANRLVRQHRRVGDQPQGFGRGNQRPELLRDFFFVLDREALQLKIVASSMGRCLLEFVGRLCRIVQHADSMHGWQKCAEDLELPFRRNGR